MLRRLFTGMLMVFMGLAIASAQNADLLIIEGSARQTTSLNPLDCINDDCIQISTKLFPLLLNVDSDTAWLIPADETSGLVESWEIDGNTVTYTLRDDKFWSDGTPITAYDVFFSYGIIIMYFWRQPSYWYSVREHTTAAAPVDDHTIRFIFKNATCETLPLVNFPIIPAHVYDANFAGTIDYTGGDILDWYQIAKLPDPVILSRSSQWENPTVTNGDYQLVEHHAEESTHLISLDGRIAYTNLYAGVGKVVDRFLSGDTNLLVEPPYDRHADLRADETSKVTLYPGNISYLITLNLADPNNPQPALDEAGNPIVQTPHPILSDPAVRRAMQMALDVDTIIDTMLDGDGVPLASILPPSSMGFDPNLEPVAYDTMAARRILHNAGWRDGDGDGIRECLTCETAQPGTKLEITLDYYKSGMTRTPLDNEVIAQLIQRQLRAVGMEVNISLITAYNKLYQQTFEAFLVDVESPYPESVIFLDFFRQKNDQPQYLPEIRGGYNFISYANPEVDRLLNQADHVPGCDVEIRRNLYYEVAAILQEDQPDLWLFSPYRMIVSRQLPELTAEDLAAFLP